MDFDISVKQAVYSLVAGTGAMPDSSRVAVELAASVADVEGAFARLHKKRLLVPEPNDPSRIRMAPPFSGVPTPFLVKAKGNSYYANCVWDALGVSAALRADAVVEASDAHTNEPMTLEVRGGSPMPRECVIHFAVPAAKWWEDIIYT
jgi:hypothetical protein